MRIPKKIVPQDTTAVPPTVGERKVGETTTTHVEPTGVGLDKLPREAVRNVDPIQATAGTALPPAVIRRTGGVPPEAVLQTGIDFNLLTLAHTVIFHKIVSVTTGVAEGTVVFEIPVTPWSDDLLNPHAKAWADLHRRFDGGDLNLVIQVITAATIAGHMKIAYVPYVYQDIKMTQSHLDAFNPVEFACNTNGQATIPIVPTVGEQQLTGAYRDSALENFGRVVCIASTSIYNAYDTCYI